MKSKELSSLLRKVADILDLVENKELDKSLDFILKTLNETKKTEKNTVLEKQPEELFNFNEIIVELHKLNSAEIEKYLSTEKFLKPKKALIALANELSIGTTTRQTVPAIRHSIIKYFERQRMDDLIRQRP